MINLTIAFLVIHTNIILLFSLKSYILPSIISCLCSSMKNL